MLIAGSPPAGEQPPEGSPDLRRDELYENGRIDVAKVQPLDRLAGNYTKVETIFELPSEDF